MLPAYIVGEPDSNTEDDRLHTHPAITEGWSRARIREELDPATAYRLTLWPSLRYNGAFKRLDRAATALGSTAWSLCPWHQLRAPDVWRCRKELAQRLAPVAVTNIMRDVYGVLEECRRRGILSLDDFTLIMSVECWRRIEPPKEARVLSRDQVKALFDVCASGSSLTSARDAAILALCYGAGLHVSEVSRVEPGDFDRETGRVRVTGRRGSVRHVYALDGARHAINDWLAVRLTGPGPMLRHLAATPRWDTTSVNSKSLAERVRVRAREAGIGTRSPRDLRATFIRQLARLVCGATGPDVLPMTPYEPRSTPAGPHVAEKKRH